MKSPVSPALVDGNAERARRQLADCITELQQQPFVTATVIPDVELEDATDVKVPHNLGRVPRWVCPSAPRGASTSGRIDDVTRESSIDRKKFLILRASGWGATITVDVAVL